MTEWVMGPEFPGGADPSYGKEGPDGRKYYSSHVHIHERAMGCSVAPKCKPVDAPEVADHCLMCHHVAPGHWPNCGRATLNTVDLSDAPASVVWPREEILREAIELTTGDRNNQYGPPTQDFVRTAAMLTAAGYRLVNAATGQADPLKGSDIAIIMNQLKVSRLMWQRSKRDSWADGAGYLGCGWENALAEEATDAQA